MRGREALDLGLGTSAGLSETAQRQILTGQSNHYKRHGTTTLFAALEVATGKILAMHSKRRRRVEFSRLYGSRHRSISEALASRHSRQPQHP